MFQNIWMFYNHETKYLLGSLHIQVWGKNPLVMKPIHQLKARRASVTCFPKSASEGIVDFKRLRLLVILLYMQSHLKLQIPLTTVPTADLVYVGQLKQDVAFMNTNSEDCWMYLWVQYIMGLQIANISDFPSSESLLPVNRWTAVFPPSSSWALLYAATSSR